MADWNIPDDLKYTENDEWVKVDGDSATIGLTDYAQDQLSDIVFVDLDGVDDGDSLDKGEAFSTVESVKAASDVYAPVGGTISAKNDALEDEPELINSDPYGQGWLVKVALSDASDLDDLLDAAAYTKHCNERES